MEVIALLMAYIFPIALLSFVLFFVVKAAVKSALDDEKYENKKSSNIISDIIKSSKYQYAYERA